jgi:hypothetical protein
LHLARALTQFLDNRAAGLEGGDGPACDEEAVDLFMPEEADAAACRQYNAMTMIPAFGDNGYLPPGIHPAALQEVLDRFGSGSAQREAQAQSLQWLVPICRRAGIAKLLINGSFVTDRLEPNDVDCVLLQGPAYRTDSDAAAELRQGLPFLEIKIVTQADYQFFAETVFGTDRDGTPKGVIEVEL